MIGLTTVFYTLFILIEFKLYTPLWMLGELAVPTETGLNPVGPLTGFGGCAACVSMI